MSEIFTWQNATLLFIFLVFAILFYLFGKKALERYLPEDMPE